MLSRLEHGGQDTFKLATFLSGPFPLAKFLGPVPLRFVHHAYEENAMHSRLEHLLCSHSCFSSCFLFFTFFLFLSGTPPSSLILSIAWSRAHLWHAARFSRSRISLYRPARLFGPRECREFAHYGPILTRFLSHYGTRLVFVSLGLFFMNLWKVFVDWPALLSLAQRIS